MQAKKSAADDIEFFKKLSVEGASCFGLLYQFKEFLSS